MKQDCVSFVFRRKLWNTNKMEYLEGTKKSFIPLQVSKCKPSERRGIG
jgi:hypothetical protein